MKLISDQVTEAEVELLCTLLGRTLASNTPGDVVELGCYAGTTSLWLMRTLQAENSSKRLHVYDSFDGLPEKDTKDTSPVGQQYVPGSLRSSKQLLVRHFKQANLPLPVIHKGWFADLSATKDMPAQISFAFLDGDFYSSIKDSFRLITPHIHEGTIIVVDDYLSESLPGAKKATDEWLRVTSRTCNVRLGMAVITI